MSGNKDIWFPAKKYGFGWGLPVTWQGWVVFLLYFLFMAIGAAALNIFHFMMPAFILYVFIVTGIFIYICWKKGEKIFFRWGKRLDL